MKRMMKTVIVIVISFLCLIGCNNPFTASQLSSAARSYESGINDGWFYSLWTNDLGTVNYTNGPAGNYSVTWYGSGITGFNFTCGKGWETGAEDRVVEYSGTFNPGNNGYLALYGWTNTPVIEYYVVENYGNWTPPGSGAEAGGSITSDGATYNLYRTQRVDQPWILGGNGTFYQYWSIRSSKRSSGTITFQNHVNGWRNAGWDLDEFIYYQIMESEGYESDGNANITVSGSGGGDVSVLENSTFFGGGDGNEATPESGDNRGTYVGGTTIADFDAVYPELDIQIDFGTITGDQIALQIQQMIALTLLGPNGVPYTKKIAAPPFIGTATISGNTLSVNDPYIWDLPMNHFEITMVDEDTLEFVYEFNGVNAYSGYGVVDREGTVPTAAYEISAMLMVIKPVDLPIEIAPKIGNGALSMTVTEERSALSVESGEWSGVVQLRFTDPNPAPEKLIEVVLIDDVGNQTVYDFKAPDSNPWYWGWGGDILFPKPETRYNLVIKKYVDYPVSFELRAW